MNSLGGSSQVLVLIGVVSACGPSREPALVDGNPGADARVVDGGSGGEVPGAGDGDVAPVTYESGSRIKARKTTVTVTTADGARSVVETFGGWYDTQRNEACSPGQAGDGKTRCLPSATALYGTYYVDAACLNQGLVLASTPGCASDGAPKYISVAPPPSCPPSATEGPRLYRAGTPSSTFYNKSGANCTLLTLDGYVIYPLGAELPPTDLAEMTTTVVTQ